MIARVTPPPESVRSRLILIAMQHRERRALCQGAQLGLQLAWLATCLNWALWGLPWPGMTTIGVVLVGAWIGAEIRSRQYLRYIEQVQQELDTI